MEEDKSNQDNSEKSVKSRTMGEAIEFRKWVTFLINKEEYAMEALNVLEVQRCSEITPVPGSKDYILGLINVRGKVITVVNARSLFNLPIKKIDDKTVIILFELNEEEIVGLLVDDMHEVINLADKNIDISPKQFGDSARSEFLKGVTHFDKKIIIILDSHKINKHITPVLQDESD